MKRTIVINSSAHLDDNGRKKIEEQVQKKFPGDRILVLDPEYKIQFVVPDLPPLEKK